MRITLQPASPADPKRTSDKQKPAPVIDQDIGQAGFHNRVCEVTDTPFKSDLQDPLVPAEVEFSSFTFISFDVDWITDSDVAFLSGDGFKATITLMAKAWKSKPAASLPDDNRLLANLVGFGKGPAAVSDWLKVREEALRDFVLCSDGRLYSRTLAPKALEAWETKKRKQGQTANATAASLAQRKGAASKKAGNVTPNVTSNVTSSVTPTKRELEVNVEQERELESELQPEREPESEVAQSAKPRRRALSKFNGRSLDLDVSQVTGLADEFAFLPNIMKDLREIDIELDREKIASRDRPSKLREKLKSRNEDLMEVPF